MKWEVVVMLPLMVMSLARPLAALTGGKGDRAGIQRNVRAERCGKSGERADHSATLTRLVRGNPTRREIALTFDDGPHPGKTDALLDLLREEGVPATFFVVGKMVDAHPELVRREAAEGHEVASHTYHHYRLPRLTPADIEEELRGGAEAVERALGRSPRLFRPPGGEYNADVVSAVRRLGQVMVLWTADPADFAGPEASVIESRLLSHISQGGILLLHDGIPETLRVLPSVIRKLKAAGYRFVTCSEMASDPGAISRGGPCVRPKQGLPRIDRRPLAPLAVPTLRIENGNMLR